MFDFILFVLEQIDGEPNGEQERADDEHHTASGLRPSEAQGAPTFSGIDGVVVITAPSPPASTS